MADMRSRLGINLAQQGNLIFLLYFGIFAASLVVGPLIDYIGNGANLLASSLLVLVSMLMFAAAHSFLVAGIGAVLLGLGGGGLNTCTNVLVSELYGEKRGPMLNLLGIFFGIGALCIPLLAASIQGHFTTSQVFIFCSVLSAACAIAYAVISFPPPAQKHAFSLRDTFAVAMYPGVLLLGFILFFESGNEACIAGWTSTYAASSGFAPRAATLALASYWGSLMLSRIAAAGALKTLGKRQLVLIAAVGSFIGCSILLSANSLALLFAGTALIGFSYGPIFPTTLAIAGDRYPNLTGTVFGLLFSIALVGGMLMPVAVGQVSQRTDVRRGMIMPFFGAIAICTLAAIVKWRDRRQNH